MPGSGKRVKNHWPAQAGFRYKPDMQRRRFLRLAGICTLALLAKHAEAASAPSVKTSKRGAKDTPIASKGDKLFTQFSLFYEKDRHLTTNYRRGILVPINTEVEIVRIGSSSIKIKMPAYKNAEIEIENVEKYSGEKIEGIFNRTLGKSPVDLASFTESEQSSIKRGEVKPGMSKAAVLRAMGYPPAHKTPSLELDQWRYWTHRVNTILVMFEDGKVAGIKD